MIGIGRSHLFPYEAPSIFSYLRTHCALHYFIHYAVTASCKILIACCNDKKHDSLYMRLSINRKYNLHLILQWFSPTSLSVRWRSCTIGYTSMASRSYLTWSVPKLRAELATRGASVGGRKTDLIERYWIYLFYSSLLWLCSSFIPTSSIQSCNMHCTVVNRYTLCLLALINVTIERILYFENLLLFLI